MLLFTDGIWLPARSVAVTMSRVTIRGHTSELGRISGPAKLTHLPVASRCDRIAVKVLPLHILPQTPQMLHWAGIEPGPHKWEARNLTTALSLLLLTYLLNTSSSDRH